MKKMKANRYWLLIFSLIMAFNSTVYAQDEPPVPEQIVTLRYFNDNNHFQYLLVESSLKTGKKLEPLGNKVFQLYLDVNDPANLITKVLTDKNGKAKAVIPVRLKSVWDSASTHTFLVVAEGTSKEEETTTEFTITKSKITLDTTNEDGVRNITATVMKLENESWVPAADVEMKLGVMRMDKSILSAGDEATYTTDSTGIATVEFTKNNLPGDLKGNIVLAASVEDNDELGNLIIERPVNWGVAVKEDKSFFDQRALWTTRFKTPYWLLIMAYSIAIGVWGTILYLVFQLVKIKKLGAEVKRSSKPSRPSKPVTLEQA
jgi:hypothetical protein